MLFSVGLIAVLAIGALVHMKTIRKQRALHARVRDLEQQLKATQQQLCHRSYLASEIAHDIKNPLTAIICSAEALELMIGETLAKEHRRSLRFICEYGDQLLRLLSDFMDISRIQTGNLESKKELVSVPHVCESVAGLLYSMAERKGVVIVTNTAESLPQAWIDPGHLKQILFNLVHNAVKFSYANSKVCVKVKSLIANGQILIEVSDSGPGIPYEKQAMIFDSYSQIGIDDLQRNQKSNGLGLVLCYSLAKLEGGDISLTSIPGEGTSVSLKIQAYGPVVCVDTTHVLSYQSRKRSTESMIGKKVLVVDSDPATRESVGTLIRALGGIIEVVDRVESLVAELSDIDYDIVMVEQGDTSSLECLIDSGQVRDSTRVVFSSSNLRQNQGVINDTSPILEKPISCERLLKYFVSDS